MESLASLVNHLKEVGILHTPRIIQVFEKIDRKHFVPKKLQNFAYADIALPIGEGQTISQPYTVAFMMELLGACPGDNVLDVGSGSGYTTALLAEIVGPKGWVIGIELYPELVAFGKKNLATFHFPHAEIREASNELGVPKKAPFDKILVSASAKEIPKTLVEQLMVGGRMVSSIRDGIWKIEKKSEEEVEIEKHSGFLFVPLIEKRGENLATR